ncbi:MAG: VacB/RNase II family 3'-5' exoribonuclease [Akkermansia sp.]|nr:VacB/RNase II family 3'-5' exoribonuclease [Akkermansia sp.]
MRKSSDAAITPLEQQLLVYMQKADYEPQDASALARGLGIDSRERPALRAIIKEWEQAGRILRLRQARYALRAPSDEPLQGRVRRIKPGKYIFVADSQGQEQLRRIMQPEGAAAIELPIMPHREGGAMDGDLVRVTLRRGASASRQHRRRTHQRPDTRDLQLEVRVDEILERRRGTWVGIYRPGGRYGTLQGDGRTAPEQVMLTTPPPPELLAGMAITVEIENYPRGKMPATGRIESVLGWPHDTGVEVTSIMHRYTLRDTFPPAVLTEAEALPQEIPAEELARREDWRERCVLTIDPASARDYDDAISLTPLPGGKTELAVHIADVSYYVRPGSALDAEAALRGNSTYLPDRVLPMLPPRLCDDLCSLRAGEDRLTKLCVITFNDKGEAIKTRFADAVICSRARLSYEQALAVLEQRESTGQEELDAMLRLGHTLASQLRTRRMQQGALSLDMPEVRVLLDAQGTPVGVECEHSDIAHQMIEEFMLAANEAVARALKAALVPTIYRVHEEPDPAKLQSFALTAKSYGIRAGSLNSRTELTRVMEQIKGHVDEQLLTVALLKAMMRARYATHALGHFGLAKGDYCHFTSPIRRYADLIVHRGFAKLAEGKHARTHLPAPGRLAEIAEHISETERNSAAAENEAHQSMLAQFLAAECESDSPRPWLAIITDAYPQGLCVEIPQLQMKGFISGDMLSDYLDSRWYFERHLRSWRSLDGRQLSPGHTLQVIPDNVDLASRFVDFVPFPATAELLKNTAEN